MLTFKKTVNVTNNKNILVQVPRAVATDWGIKKGDTLELTYKNGEVTIRPDLHGRRDISR